MKNNFIIMLALFFVIGCKDNKAEEKTEAKKEEDTSFKVSFDIILKKDDKIHLYFTQDGTLNFNETNSLWVDSKGSETPQTITFNLPKDVIPTQIRVDFGSGINEAQSDLDIKSFTMNYYDKKVVANGLDVFKYFYINESNTTNEKGTTILKKIDPKQTTGPMLYPQILLTDKINEMVKG